MPIRKRMLKKPRKIPRRVRKTRGGFKPLRSVATVRSLAAKMADPFPQRKFCKLRYSDNILLTAPNTNLSYEYILSLNGLFDPDITGTGHQPYGFDTMAVIYNNYIVRGAYVSLEWYDPSADGQIVGYRMQGTSVSGLTISALEEAPLTTCSSISNTGNQKKIHLVYVNPWDCIGCTKGQYVNDINNNGAAVGANPATQAYIRLFTSSTQAATSTTVKIKFEITYYCEFWNRNTLTQS